MHPSLPPFALIPTNIPPPPIPPFSPLTTNNSPSSLPTSAGIYPPPWWPLSFYFRSSFYIPPHQLGPRPMSPSISLPLAITSFKSTDNFGRRSSGSSTQSISCAASTSSASNCEAVSSQDSGRATGGLASSLSPMDEAGEVLPMYEFEIPNTLVGLVIGIKGKTIKELSTRTDVRMLIRQHHIPEKVDTHQICQVRGKREQINRCLQMLRRRFPPARFPELNLQPVLPPPLPSHLFDALACQPSWLTLPDEIPCEVVCSSVIDPGHFFLQQPTHPSFSSLSHLDMYMIRLYSQRSDIPDLPKPCQTGLLCAAPVLGAWFRAVTVSYNADTDEVMLRFVDYGGYTRLPRSELRQIRTDLMSLPFQAIECYLAHVQPIDGTWQWSEEAFAFFQKLCMGKVINATVVGFNISDKVPMVELTVLNEEGKPVRMDEELMNSGFAKASDPSKVQRVSATKPRPIAAHSAPVAAAV
ncbi:tudor domain protein [Dictyocaulus viviparus]|uniref:Tudor domain protein n=1 Tax=Dictyocaulus viviparus TaxID=29172 RepID=A0A0D8XPN5_DICVI|nr:tudor domain protein [Dictyocaulus viviparus]